MPPEKRVLDHDSDRSSSNKRHKHDDQPRDWRSAHFDDVRSKRKHEDDRHRYKRSEKDRDYDRDRERERERYHRSQESLPSSSSVRLERNSPSRGGSEPKTTPKPVVANKKIPSGPRLMAQRPPDDEREEGELSSTMSTNSMEESIEPSKKYSEPEPELELELVTERTQPVDEDAEARRARRAAILAKYNANPSVPPSASLNPLERVASAAGSIATPPPSTPYAMDTGAAPSPITTDQAEGQFRISKESPTLEGNHLNQGIQQNGVDELAAADYDPSRDMREDVRKAARLANDGDNLDIEDDGYEEVDDDEEEIEDMFSIAEESEKKPKKKKRVLKKKITTTAFAPDTMDTAADEEGYYQTILGEHLDGGRYQVFALVGKGMFSNVVKARVFDVEGDKDKVIGEVAIKIVRSQETMYKAGQKEVQILQKLRQSDPEDKKHLVRLERTFEHRGHLCLVFESLSMNLRDIIKKYGRDVGLHIKAVRVYAHQLFLALSHLRKCNILHADIKPDNILINESRSNLKLCDLGSASDISYETAGVAPYLVSRFYRAPEIILGMPYDCAVDVWSMGCTLYELYTGRILFPGRSNREMLKFMMEVKGKFNQKMIKKGKFGDVYFDDGGGFWEVLDNGAGDPNKKLHFTKATRDLRSRLLPNSRSGDDAGAAAEEKEILALVDLLDKCLQLDPTRRITPKEVLLHPFIRGA
ncbi:U4/U6 small nuclear ribonucleoprotein prp4 [Serendipita sp. 399]|nr:U4/U6 small nuclear ribonucleoprotein prp4 [Serendipita sp. 399]